MNAPLRISSPGGDQELEKKFVEEAAAQNMIQLKGHRSVQFGSVQLKQKWKYSTKLCHCKDLSSLNILPKRQYYNSTNLQEIFKIILLLFSESPRMLPVKNGMWLEDQNNLVASIWVFFIPVVMSSV